MSCDTAIWIIRSPFLLAFLCKLLEPKNRLTIVISKCDFVVIPGTGFESSLYCNLERYSISLILVQGAQVSWKNRKPFVGYRYRVHRCKIHPRQGSFSRQSYLCIIAESSCVCFGFRKTFREACTSLGIAFCITWYNDPDLSAFVFSFTSFNTIDLCDKVIFVRYCLEPEFPDATTNTWLGESVWILNKTQKWYQGR